MLTQKQMNYDKIARAIEFIQMNFREQPSLEKIAAAVHLSPAHFQRLFTQWAGTSPKKFLQYISLNHAREILRRTDAHNTLLDATIDTGLSSTSRLHDLFIQIEGMTPAEFQKEGRNLTIHYQFAQSPFGQLLIASTDRGICYTAFEPDEEEGRSKLIAYFPQAILLEKSKPIQEAALNVFRQDWTALPKIRLHLKGTPFQLKVWETLLKIPMGRLSTYGAVAEAIGQPGASRAVGTAIGHNPIAYLIPCHRVIQATGAIGGYKWGTTRKTALFGWENARLNNLIEY